jgi:cysteinyl-tRNA synthetase
VNSVLGLQPSRLHNLQPADQGSIESGLQVLLEQREAARKSRDFKRADAIREELKAKGWLVEDTPKGPKLKQI